MNSTKMVTILIFVTDVDLLEDGQSQAQVVPMVGPNHLLWGEAHIFAPVVQPKETQKKPREKRKRRKKELIPIIGLWAWDYLR